MDETKDESEKRTDESRGTGPADSESTDAPSEDTAQMLSALRAELREVRRELRSIAHARWERVVLSLKESLIGVIAWLVMVGALLTMAIVGALALAGGLHDGLLVWTARPWLAGMIEGLLLLVLVASAYPILRWSIGRNAVRRVVRVESARERSSVPRGDVSGSAEGAA